MDLSPYAGFWFLLARAKRNSPSGETWDALERRVPPPAGGKTAGGLGHFPNVQVLALYYHEC